MHFYKLIKSLQALDPVQIKSLDKYVRSPYFGVYMPSVLLFEHMASLHPRFPNRKITFEAIAQLGESLNTLKRQETAATRLMRSIENFIAQEEWQKKEGEVNRYRMRGYKALGLETEFDKAFEKEMKRLKEDPEQDIDVFSERHLLTEMTFNGLKARLVRGPSNNLLPVVTTLDEFYAIKKIRYLCEVVNRRQLNGNSYHSQQVSTLWEILKPYNSPEYPYIYVFLSAYKMLKAKNYNESLSAYSCIKKMAEQNNGSDVPQSLREAMGYAVNSTLHWFNMGNEEAGKEYLWWMEWRMKNNLLLDKGKLLPVTFRNMMVLSVGNQDPKWIKETISFYGSYLPEEYQKTYLAFAKGLYHYASKNYKEASRFFLLAQAKEEVVLNCIVRRWQWMCSYECDSGDTDFLLNQITSYEKYLLRNKREIQHILSVFESFIDGAKRLLNAATSADFNKELEFIQNQPHFTSKSWLVRQFSEKKIGTTRVVSGPDFK
jgi:hypothetical protein